MSTFHDILQIDKTPKTTPKSTNKQTPRRRPTGMSRELFNLTGGVSIMPTPPPVKAKRKYGVESEVRERPLDKWRWVPFRSSARTDGATFSHWRRETEPENDYHFASFNARIGIPRYTDAEYNEHLQDPHWTREETDRLMALADQYDLRFPVIADRFGSSRPIEDLKDRFYTCARVAAAARLATEAPAPPPDPDEDAMILDEEPGEALRRFATYRYDPKHAQERRRLLEELYGRTAEDVRRDLQAVEDTAELERLVRRVQKHRTERRRQMRTPGPHGTPGMGRGTPKGRRPDMPLIPTTPMAPPQDYRTSTVITQNASLSQLLRGTRTGVHVLSRVLAPFTVPTRTKQIFDELKIRPEEHQPTLRCAHAHALLRQRVAHYSGLLQQFNKATIQVKKLQARRDALLPPSEGAK